MVELGSATLELRVDDRAFNSGIDTAQRKAGGLGSALKSVATTAGGFLLAQGIQAGLTNITGFLSGSSDAASDFAESLSKTKVVFGDFAGGLITWSEASAETLGISQQKALEAVSTFGNLFTAMGTGIDVAADLSPQIVQLASDLASFNNANPEDVLLALRSGLVGEVEPLRKFGVNLSASAVEAKALEMGLADANGEISEGAKIQARFALLLEQTATAQGDFARTADGAANKARIADATYEDLQATLGEKLLPLTVKITEAKIALADFIVTRVMPAVEDLSETFERDWLPVIRQAVDWVRGELSPAVERFADFLQRDVTPAVRTVASWLGDKLGGAVQDLSDWFSNHLAPAASRIVAGFRSDVLPILQQLWQSIQNDLGPVLQDLVATFNNDVRPALGQIGEGIQMVAGFVVDAAVPAMSFLADAFAEAWNVIQPIVHSMIDIMGLIGETFADVVALVGALASGDWSMAWGKAKEIVANIGAGIMAYLQGLGGALYNLGYLLFDKLLQGLKAGWDAIVGWITSLPNPLDLLPFDLPGLGGIPGVGSLPGLGGGGVSAGALTAPLRLAPGGMASIASVRLEAGRSATTPLLAGRSGGPLIQQQINGLTPEEVTRQTRRAFRQLAVEFGGAG